MMFQFKETTTRLGLDMQYWTEENLTGKNELHIRAEGLGYHVPVPNVEGEAYDMWLDWQLDNSAVFFKKVLSGEIKIT